MYIRIMLAAFALCMTQISPAVSGQGNLALLNDSNYQTVGSQGITLMDFYADWCGPCQKITPIMNDLAVEFQGRATLAKVNADESKQMLSVFKVVSLPTLILFRDGKEVRRIVGMTDKETLRQLISSNL